VKKIDFTYKIKIKQPLLAFILFSNFLFSQTTLSGKVLDTNNKALRNVNVMAIPKSSTSNLKFSTANNKGEYALTLDKNSAYEITVSYLGYFEQKQIIEE
jgi:hypothetical protein